MPLSRAISTLPEDLERLISDTIRCCLAVHRALGPGLSEGAYARACCIELTSRRIPFESEKAVTVSYCGQVVSQHRIDLLIDKRLVLEIKAVERIHPVHVAQTVSYLRATGTRAGLVVNFNVPILKQGIKRVAL
jgi:GxxExxY protein